MKIRAFHVGDGDCILIQGNDDTVILADGGRSTPFQNHVMPILAGLDTDIDLVYISHIDNDHISGALKLVRTEIDWRVHDFLSAQPDFTGRPPRRERPKEIKQIWHNGFAELVNDQDGKIHEALDLATQTLALSPSLFPLFEMYENLTTGVKESLEMNYRLELGGMNNLLNRPSSRNDGLLTLSDAKEKLELGDFEIFILGPTVDDLNALRDYWNKWLDKHDLDVAALREKSKNESTPTGLSEEEALINLLLKEAEKLGQGSAKVSEPNVASLTLLLDDGNRKVLLTGDARSEEILAGLRKHGLIQDGQGFHVDVLKVQHHGAAGNVTEEFCRTITADHYLFCANGAHTNPEKVVLDGFLDFRIGSHVAENLSPKKDEPFTFWFTTHSSTEGITPTQKTYLQSVEEHLDSKWPDDTGHFKREYPKPDDLSSVTIEL